MTYYFPTITKIAIIALYPFLGCVFWFVIWLVSELVSIFP